MEAAAKRIVERFGLRPHPEGGYFREVYRSPLLVTHPAVLTDGSAQRSGGTFIYYLLADEEFSAFHRVRCTDEIWHLYAGGPLELHMIDERGEHSRRELTTDLERGEPTAIVRAGCWQAVRLAAGALWAFGGCTVAPGFEFADFEMPAADELIEAFPAHAAILRELGRR